MKSEKKRTGGEGISRSIEVTNVHEAGFGNAKRKRDFVRSSHPSEELSLAKTAELSSLFCHLHPENPRFVDKREEQVFLLHLLLTTESFTNRVNDHGVAD